MLLLLPLVAVLLRVVPVSASRAVRKCPSIDCTLKNRESCRPGSSECGPCLSLWMENMEKKCVLRTMTTQRGKPAFYPNVDEEIDYLQSIIEKQQVTEIKPPKKQMHETALSSQTDVNKGKADASKHEPKDRMSDGMPHATAAAPRPALSVLPDASTPEPIATAVGHRFGPIVVPPTRKDNIIVIIISLCVVVGTIAVILATVCYIKQQRDSHLAEKVDYPAFGGVGVPAATTNGTSMGDKTLAQSAQMYHYQHQKQQMLSMGNHKPEQKSVDTELTSEEEDVGGDFTVYECPGLAPTGEMEVKNPLFDDSNLHCEESQK